MLVGNESLKRLTIQLRQHRSQHCPRLIRLKLLSLMIIDIKFTKLLRKIHLKQFFKLILVAFMSYVSMLTTATSQISRCLQDRYSCVNHMKIQGNNSKKLL